MEKNNSSNKHTETKKTKKQAYGIFWMMNRGFCQSLGVIKSLRNGEKNIYPLYSGSGFSN